MTRTKVDNFAERQIVINLIMSDAFVRQISPMLKTSLFKTSYAKEVASWVLEHYNAYNEAPKNAIQDIYLEKKQSASYDEDTAESIATFLQSLSKEYTQKNLEYSIDQAESYLKLRSLENFKEQLETAIATNDPTKGESLIANFARVGKPEGEGIAIIHDANAIIDAFEMQEEELFTYPKALGKVCGKKARGDLSACLAAVKVGKSHFLWYTAEQAMLAGNKVAFFSLEMTKAQVIRRAWSSLTATPKYPGTFLVPYFDLLDGEAEGAPIYEILFKETTREPMPFNEIDEFYKRIRMRFKGGDCRIFAVPGYTTTVEDIINHLDNMKYYDNYDPDVVVIDYADILKASASAGKEYRHQLNDIWLKLRWLARSRNIHIVTASQTSRNGFNKDLNIADIAEDMRKLAHVSSLVGLNQTKKEKKEGIIRVTDLLQREDASSPYQAVVLQNLSLGRFHLDSKLENEVSYDRGEEKKGRKK